MIRKDLVVDPPELIRSCNLLKEKTGSDIDINRFRSNPEEKEKGEENLKPQKTLSAEVHAANHDSLHDSLDKEGKQDSSGTACLKPLCTRNAPQSQPSVDE